MRNEMQECDINRKSLIHRITDFVRKILPSNIPLSRGTPKIELPEFSPRLSELASTSIRTYTATETASPSSPSTSREIIFETPKHIVGYM